MATRAATEQSAHPPAEELGVAAGRAARSQCLQRRSTVTDRSPEESTYLQWVGAPMRNDQSAGIRRIMRAGPGWQCLLQRVRARRRDQPEAHARRQPRVVGAPLRVALAWGDNSRSATGAKGG